MVPPPPKNVEPHWHNDPDEPTTGEFEIAAAAEAPEAIAYVKRIEAKLKKRDSVSEFKMTVGIVVVSISTAFAAFFTLESRAQAKLDPVEARVVKLEDGQQKQALSINRIEVMMEIQLKNQGITPPPKLAPDGGTP